MTSFPFGNEGKMCLQLRLPLDEVVHEEVFAIPDGVGEEGHPFAEDEETGVA